MKYKSQAISLTYIKNGDSSIISKILTKEKGLQAFIVKGVRSKKSKKKLSYFEPLRLLNIDADFNARKSLQYLGDATIAVNFDNMKNKMNDSFIGFFIAEISSKVVQENEQNKLLFDFIWETSIELYSSKITDPNFALKYLINLSRFLGFYPSETEIQKPFFDLESGVFSDKITSFSPFLNKQKTTYLKALINNERILIPQKQKSELLKELLYYYKLHHYNLDGITSHLVIEALRQ
jgi:DNA repair protein RecO (recombination protein O)